MKNLSLFLAIFFALAFLSGSALAMPDVGLTIKDAAGAIISETNPYSACPGPILDKDVKIYVKNLGASSDTFSIFMTLPTGWDGSILPSVTLASGEEKQLNLFLVNMPYTTAPGKYYITVRAESNTNPNDFITKDIVVDIQACHVVELNVIDAYKETCQETAGSLVYRIDVTNKGKWEEEFALSSDKDWATFSQSRITLSSQETKRVELMVTPPENLEGEQKIGINVQGFMEGYPTPAYDEDEVKAFLINCFDFDASISPLEHTVCVGRSKTYTLSIENTGTDEDTYLLAAPDWVELSQDSITIPAGQLRQIEAVATPDSAGKVNFNIAVASQNDPSVKKTVTGSIVAEECRGVAVIVSPTQVTACKGSEVKYNVAVKNTGTIENTFTLESSHGSLEEESLMLSPGETKSTRLSIDSTDLEGNITVMIKATDGVVSDQSTSILVLDECYLADVAVSADTEAACPCGTVKFTIDINNTGKLPDTYTAIFDGEEKSLQLASGESGSVTFQKDVPCDQAGNLSYPFEVSSEHKIYSSGTFELEVMDREECYSVHLLTEGTTESIQGGRAVAIKLTVANNGKEADAYAIDVSGPAWAYVSPTSVTLGSGSSEDVYLYVFPPFGASESNQEIRVTARSEMASSDILFSVHVGGEGQVTMENITQEEPGNVTIERPGEIKLNVSFGNITGEFTDMEERPFWKTVTVAVITLVIILILVVRFVFLFRK